MLQVRVMKYILGGPNHHWQPARFVLDYKKRENCENYKHIIKLRRMLFLPQ